MERVPAARNLASWPCTGNPPGRYSDPWWAGAALWHVREVAPAFASKACAVFRTSLISSASFINSYSGAQAPGKLPRT